MKLEQEWNLSTLDSQLAFLMKRKSKSFVEHPHTWLQRLLVRLNMQALQQTFGRLVSYFMLFCVEGFHSKAPMIRNCTPIFVNKNCLLLITFRNKESNFCRKYFKRTLKKGLAPRIFYETLGCNSLIETQRWWVQSQLLSSVTWRKFLK